MPIFQTPACNARFNDMSGFLQQYSVFIYNYAGLFWIPVALLAAHKPHKLMAAGLVVISLLTLRLQVELMESIGYSNGFLPVMASHVSMRGLVVYSLMFALFLLLARFSPRTQNTIFFAAALSVYILTVCFSMLLMIL